MENSKNKTDNFLKAIKKYADEQRSAMQTEVAQLKEEKLKEATEKGRHDSEKYIKDKLEESRNRQTASECDSDIRHRCENSCQKEVLCGIYKRRQSDCGTSGADGSACGIDGAGKYPDPERNAKQRQPSGQLRDCQYQ